MVRHLFSRRRTRPAPPPLRLRRIARGPWPPVTAGLLGLGRRRSRPPSAAPNLNPGPGRGRQAPAHLAGCPRFQVITSRRHARLADHSPSRVAAALASRPPPRYSWTAPGASSRFPPPPPDDTPAGPVPHTSRAWTTGHGPGAGRATPASHTAKPTRSVAPSTRKPRSAPVRKTKRPKDEWLYRTGGRVCVLSVHARGLIYAGIV